MKIKCCSCEVGEAVVFCCSDDAVFCLPCDEKIHVTSNHQRVLLSSTSARPRCEVRTGFFFCSVHKALLCRDCDLYLHQPYTQEAAHARFVLTGARVGEIDMPISEPAIVGGSASSSQFTAGSSIPPGDMSAKIMQTAHRGRGSNTNSNHIKPNKRKGKHVSSSGLKKASSPPTTNTHPNPYTFIPNFSPPTTILYPSNNPSPPTTILYPSNPSPGTTILYASDPSPPTTILYPNNPDTTITNKRFAKFPSMRPQWTGTSSSRPDNQDHVNGSSPMPTMTLVLNPKITPDMIPTPGLPSIPSSLTTTPNINTHDNSKESNTPANIDNTFLDRGYILNSIGENSNPNHSFNHLNNQQLHTQNTCPPNYEHQQQQQQQQDGDSYNHLFNRSLSADMAEYISTLHDESVFLSADNKVHGNSEWWRIFQYAEELINGEVEDDADWPASRQLEQAFMHQELLACTRSSSSQPPPSLVSQQHPLDNVNRMHNSFSGSIQYDPFPSTSTQPMHM